MQNSIKRVLIIFPMILLFSMSFVGTDTKAEDKVDKQYDSFTTSSNQNKEDKDTKSSDSENSTTIYGQDTKVTSQNIVEINNKQDSNEQDLNEQTSNEQLPKWKTINGKLYYFINNRILEKTGWFREKDKNPNANNNYEYYLDKNYAATIGWKRFGDSWYYFNDAGIMQTGWQLINYNWFHLDEEGIMDIGWIEDDRNKFYLSDNGYMAIGKKCINGNWYYFGGNGVLQTGFYNNNGKTYYSSKDGIMRVNEWISTINGSKYYVKADSSLATGNAIIDNVMEKFDSNGKYIGKSEMKNHLFIKYLNVGSADCAFIKLPSGETALIDTGDVTTSEKVVNFLKEQDLKQKDGKGLIDYIIITHGHSDHIGGLTSILNNFQVEKVYIPDIAIIKDWYSNVKVTTESAASIEMMKTDYDIYNDAVNVMKDKNIKFTNTENSEYIDKNKILQFVQSDKDFGGIGSEKISEYYWGINENSAIVYLNYGDLQVLFAADIGANSEKDFWASDLLNGRDVDILKVPHHGNDASSTVDFIRYLKPEVGIISRSNEDIKKNTAFDNLISNGVSLYETSGKDGISIYATIENWTLQN